MATADSTIRTHIIGDARSLERASKDSEKAVGRIGSAAKVAGGILAGAFAVDALLDFGQTALAEADRIGDATARLEEQLGGLSAPLIDAADSFLHLGQSSQDILELEARFADIATAAQLSDAAIAGTAQTAAETAAALALLGENDAATILDLIAKAGSGADKPLKELGISLTDAEVEARALATTGKDTADALTESELAAARFELVLQKLAPRMLEVTTGTGDLEQSQAELQARFEDLTGRIGDAVDGPLNDFLGWILTGIDGLGVLGAAVDLTRLDFLQFLGTIGNVTSAVAGFVDVMIRALGLAGQFGPINLGGGGSRPPNHAPHPGITPPAVTIQVQGGSPEATERAVLNAYATLTGRGSIAEFG